MTKARDSRRPLHRDRRRPAVYPRKSSPFSLVFALLLRLLVIVIGFSVIAGTGITLWHHVHQSATPAPTVAATPTPPTLTLDPTLTTNLEKLIQSEEHRDLTAHLMVWDLDTGSIAAIAHNQPVPAASTIKLPLLIAFFAAVDRGEVRLDEALEINKSVRVGEAGNYQDLPDGTKVPALEAATQMIVISDNTATNMILQRLGGMDVTNRQFRQWGLLHTSFRAPLPDLEGTNTVSAQDLVKLLAQLDQGDLLSPRSRDRALDILRRPITRTLLPQGIREEDQEFARIAHKPEILPRCWATPDWLTPPLASAMRSPFWWSARTTTPAPAP
ncbi:MAG: serine hydrolase [Oscillatoriales cyanobacterium SM2_2_1]|nr:serine hydrolase [Oscillatoriales cyanobacterium SM2_2_1]